jgi:ribosome recycling factor
MAIAFNENLSLKVFEKYAFDAMKISVDFFEKEIGKLRTNKAHPSLVEDIRICVDGNNFLSIKKIALITIVDATILLIKPFDIAMLPLIEKAISQSDLNISPKNDGVAIKVILPPMSKERRLEFVKLLSKKGEEAIVQLRKFRQDILNEIKKAEKGKDLSQDLSQRLQKGLQMQFDSASSLIEQLTKKKEISLLQD